MPGRGTVIGRTPEFRSSSSFSAPPRRMVHHGEGRGKPVWREGREKIFCPKRPDLGSGGERVGGDGSSSEIFGIFARRVIRAAKEGSSPSMPQDQLSSASFTGAGCVGPGGVGGPEILDSPMRVGQGVAMKIFAPEKWVLPSLKEDGRAPTSGTSWVPSVSLDFPHGLASSRYGELLVGSLAEPGVLDPKHLLGRPLVGKDVQGAHPEDLVVESGDLFVHAFPDVYTDTYFP